MTLRDSCSMTCRSSIQTSLDNAYEISVDESNLVSGDTKAAEAIKAWFSKVQEKNGGLG